MTPPSKLRTARLRRNWTLAQVVRELEREAHAPTGARESLLSAWELGKIRPSLHYRDLLCRVYDTTPEDLGFLDDPLTGPSGPPIRLLTSFDDLLDAMITVAEGARQFLVATGSRSRERTYLEAIERVIREHPGLVHYRILFGPPSSVELHDHMLALLRLRDPEALDRGVKTLHIGLIDLGGGEPERFICASERQAVLAIPSLTTPGNFDTGVAFDGAPEALAFVSHVKQLVMAARRIETVAALG